MPLLRFIPETTNVDFVKYRFWAFGLDGLLVVITVLSIWLHGFSFGIDFTGGVLMEVKSAQVIDIGKKGPSPGDQIIETTVDFQNGKRVDRSVLNCVDITVTARGFDVLCHGSLVFRGGQVEFQGETSFHTPFTVAVTGGSGAYQHVGGQLTVVRTLPHSTTDVETLRLVFFETG